MSKTASSAFPRLTDLPGLRRLIEVMARLRDPSGGCPWDLEQDFASIAPYTLEETYELVEAIESGDKKAMKDELGDVLFQCVFHAQMADEKGWFDLDSVAQGVADKMIERHPHVFGDRDAKTSADVLTNWEADKEAKRKAQAAAEARSLSVLDGVSSALPAATRAVKLQKRAARVGFDWPRLDDIFAKLEEETGELKAEIAAAEQDKMEDELGDMMFVVANLARKLDIDPETALRRANRKFERRFQGIEAKISSEGRTMSDASLEEMERIWQEVKRDEKRGANPPSRSQTT